MVGHEQLWKVALASDVEQAVWVLTAHLHGSLRTVQAIPRGTLRVRDPTMKAPARLWRNAHRGLWADRNCLRVV